MYTKFLLVPIPPKRITLSSFGNNIWGGLLVRIDDAVGNDVGVQWTMVEVMMMLLVKLLGFEVERERRIGKASKGSSL